MEVKWVEIWANDKQGTARAILLEKKVAVSFSLSSLLLSFLLSLLHLLLFSFSACSCLNILITFHYWNLLEVIILYVVALPLVSPLETQ